MSQVTKTQQRGQRQPATLSFTSTVIRGRFIRSVPRATPAQPGRVASKRGCKRFLTAVSTFIGPPLAYASASDGLAALPGCRELISSFRSECEGRPEVSKPGLRASSRRGTRADGGPFPGVESSRLLPNMEPGGARRVDGVAGSEAGLRLWPIDRRQPRRDIRQRLLRRQGGRHEPASYGSLSAKRLMASLRRR